jgi:Membrane protein involved in the export of O-antigen and teichoic acid
MDNIDNVEERIYDTEQEQKNKMVEGSLWLTLGNFASRLLGAIYIIPWYHWMGSYGNEANALFGMGYNIYALFLLISTSGIPVAVAKEVAKFNALDDENQSYRLVRRMLGFMLVLGAIVAVIMFMLAPALAGLSGSGRDLIPVMRSLALAVFVFPSMSVIRGFFQGNNNLKPVAISQLAEQIVRVIWMLVMTFIIMKLGDKNYVRAVTQSTTAAFIGMIASLAVLFYYLYKTGMLEHLINPGPVSVHIDAVTMLKDTVIQAIPFIVLGSAIQIFKLIDQFTFSNTMRMLGNFTDSDLITFFSYLSSNPDKLTMILIAVGMSISGVGIPLITENYFKGNERATANLISDNIVLYAAFMIPAVAGLSMLAQPAYTLFYDIPNNLALNLFVFASIQSLFLGLYVILTPMMQALHYSRLALKYFAFIILLKLVIQVPFIYLYESYGPLISTTLCFIIGNYMFLKKIQEITNFSIVMTLRRIVSILMLTVVMALVTAVVFALLRLVIVPNTKFKSLIDLLLSGGAGFAAYLYLLAKLRIIDLLLGDRGTRLRQKLRL